MQELIESINSQHTAFLGADDDGCDLLSNLRQQSMEKLNVVGLPTLKDENWRYTNTKSIVNNDLKIVLNSSSKVSKQQIQPYIIEDFDCYRIVVVDGFLERSLSSTIAQSGVELNAIEEVLKTQPQASRYLNQLLPANAHGFNYLNTAFINNGIWLNVQDNVEVDKPIEILYVSSLKQPAVIQPRNVFVFAQGAKINIIERYINLSDDKSMTNSISEIYCHEKSNIEHVRIQLENNVTNHISGTYVSVDNNANYSISTVTLGGNLTRNDINCKITGSNAHCDMYGLYAANGRQHIDNFTQVEHCVEDSTSDELYKGVLDDRSRAVFHGRIYVAQDAQRTDAYQNNRNLILSRQAEIDTKPQLEIYADDVKCSHGATIGQLDEDYLFYLRARGIGLEQAKQMLIFAFINDALARVSNPKLKSYLENQISEHLVKGGHFNG